MIIISKILHPVFGGRDWCVPWKCPCLTCELWLNDDIEPDCACKPCSVKGLRQPEDVWCWKTSETCRAFDKLTTEVIPSRKEIAERNEIMKANEKMKREQVLQIAKPILFNTEMVRAIQGGRKKVTRRIAKPQPKDKNDIIYKHPECGQWFISPDDDNVPETRIKPPYKVGDVLYVRETWAKMYCCNCDYDNEECEYNIDRSGLTITCDDGVYVYKATDSVNTNTKWHPSIHMPKEAARIFLRVTDVRVERLQDIRYEDCLAEGVQLTFLQQRDLAKRGLIAWNRFSVVWDSTVKKSDLSKYGWNANPWVWVIEFERISKEEAYGNQQTTS